MEKKINCPTPYNILGLRSGVKPQKVLSFLNLRFIDIPFQTEGVGNSLEKVDTDALRAKFRDRKGITRQKWYLITEQK